jgi:hypothetical protein
MADNASLQPSAADSPSFFEHIWDVWKILKINRWPISMTVIVLSFVTVIPNGQDLVVRIISTPDSIHRGTWARWWFLLSLIIYSFTVWYWSRQTLSFQFHDWPPRLKDREDPSNYEQRMKRIEWWHAQIPRWTGIATIGLISALVSYHLYVAQIDDTLGFLACLWIVTVLIGLFIYSRRRVFKMEKAAPPFQTYRSLANLPLSAKWALALSLLGLSIGMFVVILFWHMTIAPTLGAVTILLCAAAAWIPVGCLATYFGNHHRIPIFTLLLVEALAVSSCNDNHPVYTCAAEMNGCPTHTAEDRPTIPAHLARWIAQRPGEQRPLVIVATDGGGIRAAYWTSAVLARLGEHPQFSQHLFAISGVSGGSLGGIVYAGLLAEQTNGSDNCHGWKGIRACAKSILSYDFTAPAFAMMVYPDLVQRFLFRPFVFTAFDRGAALENGWSEAWKSVVASHAVLPSSPVSGQVGNRFEQAFGSLWRMKSGEWSTTVPSLFLNSTSVEHGVRVIKSSLRLSEQVQEGGVHCVLSPRDYGFFRNVIDLDDALACQSDDPNRTPQIPLRSAAHNSSRFTWISPAGRVTEALHVVDGGYFENAGATTAGELLQRILETDPSRTAITPIIIHITNDPEVAPSPKQRYLSELMTPIWTLFKTRTGRATYAESWLQQLTCRKDSVECHYYEIGIIPPSAIGDGRPNIQLPLGWTLSKAAINEMDNQLESRAAQCKNELQNSLVIYLACIERAPVLISSPQ